MKAKEKQDLQTELANSLIEASINGILALEAIRDTNDNVIDFQLVKFNELFLKVIDKQAAEISERSYLSLLPTSKENGMFDLKCQVMETGKPIRTTFYYKGSDIDGWFDISISPLGTNGVIETFTDITESKLDKEKLERSAKRFETVVNTSKAGMHTLTPVKNEQGEVVDFRFGIVNQAVADYIGQSAEVLTVALASVYFPAYMTNGLFTMYKDNYENGTHYNFDFHYEDGYDVFFQIDVTKMGEEVLVTFTDQTHLKRLQRELENKVKELGRSNRNLEDFAHAASHDLKEPLRKVRIFTDRLKHKLETRITKTEEDLFERIESATERMQQLVDDLLEFSHVSNRPHKMEAVNLNDKVEKVLSDLELSIEEKQAKIIADPLPTVKGHRRQLQQLLQNLIGNALKYSKPDLSPVITIQSRLVKGAEIPVNLPSEQANKPFYLIEITDNGIGFEQQYAERIFNMFERLHGKAEYSGTGVGLSIARKVVENHQGYIWAVGKPGEGATFSILLPAE